ncbi:MAG: hypothetical protein Q3Y17_05620, partial [Blautia sp.]|nr:hypothetical protein [Blautia sp.]
NKNKRNDSIGLHIHCADRKKVYHGQAKIPSPKAILHGFLPVTVKVLNSYKQNNRRQVPQTFYCHKEEPFFGQFRRTVLQYWRKRG